MNVLFFRADENDLAEEFKRFLPVNVTTSFVTLEPALGIWLTTAPRDILFI